MARVIDKLPKKEVVSRLGLSKYPLDEWLDGRVWAILYGEDYRCQHLGILSVLRKHAQTRGGVLEARRLQEDREQIGWAVKYTQIQRAAA